MAIILHILHFLYPIRYKLSYLKEVKDFVCSFLQISLQVYPTTLKLHVYPPHSVAVFSLSCFFIYFNFNFSLIT